MTTTISPELKKLAKDLNKDYPRSCRDKIGDYILLARIVDKCRAYLAGTNGEYDSGCGLDMRFHDFTGISVEDFRNFVVTGASDEAIGAWVAEHSKVKEREQVILWNNQLRNATMKDVPEFLQVAMEDYVEKHLPKGSVIYTFFDIYDIEEGRLQRALKQ